MTDSVRAAKANLMAKCQSIQPVLNQPLYEALQRCFGDVVVAKPGCPLIGGVYVSESGRLKFRATDSGEYYRANCPFCEDSRQRLWVNHRYAVGLDEHHPAKSANPEDKFLWSAICYNENCLERPDNRKALYSKLFSAVGREMHRPVATVPVSNIMAPLATVELPGTCVRVDELPAYHPACAYLTSRAFDPQQLGEIYDVHVCEEAPVDCPLVNGWIIMPIYMRGQRIGWQARVPYEANFSGMRIPKYYFKSGVNKSMMLYGYDLALTMPFCIVVEGVTDVWRIGAGAVATFGKSMSFFQAELIYQNWPKAVIAYDNDAKDYVLRAEALLSSKMEVVPVLLPEGEDPASMGEQAFWDLVYESAEQRNIDLLASTPR